MVTLTNKFSRQRLQDILGGSSNPGRPKVRNNRLFVITFEGGAPSYLSQLLCRCVLEHPGIMQAEAPTSDTKDSIPADRAKLLNLAGDNLLLS